MTTNTRFNYVSSKATKLRKLVTWATDVEIQNRKFCQETRDSSFCIIPLYVNFDDRRWRWQWKRLTKMKRWHAVKANFMVFQGCSMDKHVGKSGWVVVTAMVMMVQAKDDLHTTVKGWFEDSRPNVEVRNEKMEERDLWLQLKMWLVRARVAQRWWWEAITQLWPYM